MKVPIDAPSLEVPNHAGVGSSVAHARIRVVEDSLEGCSLAEPIEVSRGNDAAALSLSDATGLDAEHSGAEDIAAFLANPLREDPETLVIGATQRFGVVGLVACALGTGLSRWCRSLVR
jgi:hypothetical protein